MKKIMSYGLFNRLRGTRPWVRVFTERSFTSAAAACRYWQSYLLSGILPGEDGDLDHEYRVRRIRG